MSCTALFFACLVGVISLIKVTTGARLKTSSRLSLHQEFLDERPRLNVSVRAENCINNATHCHCDLYPNTNNERWCIKLIHGSTDTCTKVACSSGYHCDCASHQICDKKSTTAYAMAMAPAPALPITISGQMNHSDDDHSNHTHMEFPCAPMAMTIPKGPVTQTSDLTIQALGEYQLYLNGNQVGSSTTNSVGVFTEELQSGDVISIYSQGTSVSEYGVKFTYTDLSGNIQKIDSTWASSTSFSSNWLDSGFDPAANGWVSPSSVSMSGAGFDPSVPWMWGSTAGGMVYFQRTVVA